MCPTNPTAPNESTLAPSFPNVEFLLLVLEQDTENLGEQLRMIKRALNPTGRSQDFWVNSKSWLPKTTKNLQPHIQNLEEEINMPLEWERLEEWLRTLRKCREEQQAALRFWTRTMDRDFPDLTNASAEVENMSQIVMESLESHPKYRMVRREVGTQWFSCHKQITNLTGINIFDSDKFIPMEKVRAVFNERAGEILHHWHNLQKMAEEGAIDCFRQQWAQLTISERGFRLQQHFPKLDIFPHSDIYEWTRHLNVEHECLNRQAFMMPLLNVLDLSQGSLLPDLLQARASLHPKLFLAVDSRHVRFGLWCKALISMQIEGRISLSPEEEYGDTVYGFRLEDSSVTDALLENPSVFLHQLQAQKRIYDFFIKCLSALVGPSEQQNTKILPSDDTLRDEPISILNQYIQLKSVRPDYIDWEQLQSLLKASLNEALDELWQVRTDATTWLLRMKEVQRPDSGRSSKLLHAMFGRIDVFHALCERMDTLQDRGWCGTQYHKSAISPPSGQIGSFKDVISMHIAFESVLHEAICSMGIDPWYPGQNTNATFSRLINMMNKNDPTLRIMGLDAVARVIEREIQVIKTQEAIPPAVMKALNDISVVAVCMRETQKHFTFINLHSFQYANMTNQAAAEWSECKRPWKSAVDQALRMPESRRRKLDSVIFENSPVEERHRAFWNTIDENLKLDKRPNMVVDTILCCAPTENPLPSVEFNPQRDWSINEATVTATKATLSKRRRKIAPPSPPSVIPLSISKLRPSRRPLITINKDVDKSFWEEIWADNGGTFKFLDLCAFLDRAGYIMYNQGGAGRRFELKAADGSFLHAIVFHEPHGPHRAKINHHQARNWWARRIRNEVDVVSS